MKRRAAVWLALCLLAVFLLGGCKIEVPEKATSSASSFSSAMTSTAAQTDTVPISDGGQAGSSISGTSGTGARKTEQDRKENLSAATQNTQKSSGQTASPNKDKQQDAGKQESVQMVCTVSIRCDTVLKNWNRLAEEKRPYVPKDGVILAARTASYSKEETVWDVFLRETKKAGIVIDFEYTPVYKSYYVKGISQLYEKDCGSSSGWIYKVNGKMAPVGCNQYKVKPGDRIEWLYTCVQGDVS